MLPKLDKPQTHSGMRGGGFAFSVLQQSSEQQTLLRSSTNEDQPLVKLTRNSKRIARISSTTNGIYAFDQPLLRDINRQYYQGLSSKKSYDEIQTQKLLFHTKVTTEHDHTPSTTLFITKQNRDSIQTVEDLPQNGNSVYTQYQKKLSLCQLQPKKFIIQKFKMKDQLQLTHQASRIAQQYHRNKQKSQFDEFYDVQNPLRKYLIDFLPNMRKLLVTNLLTKILYFKENLKNSKMQLNKCKQFYKVNNSSFKLNSPILYFYLKDGRPVQSANDIPFDQHTLIFSSNPAFKGLKNLDQLALLESKIRNVESEQQTKPIQESFQFKYQEKVNQIVEILDGDQLSSNQLSSVLKKIKRKPLNRNISSLLPKNKSRFSMEEQQQYIESEEPIITNDRLAVYEQIDNWYDSELRKVDFEQELQGDIHQVQPSTNDENNEQIREQIKQVAGLLDPLLNKHLNQKVMHEQLNTEQAGMEINFGDEEEVKNGRDMLEENRKGLLTMKQHINRLHSINRELFVQNIPRLLGKTKFNRFELHNTYLLYCALQMITSQRYKYYNTEDGIDFKTYRTGIYQVFMQSEELAQSIFDKIDFNYSGFLNWEEFLDLMVIIRAKTLKEKIDLFIKISDEDGNGQLSKDEVFNLSKICLSKFIEPKDGDDFLDMLCEYFTRLIFQAVEVGIDAEIPLERIKEVILSGNQDSDLLCMFCGADM